MSKTDPNLEAMRHSLAHIMAAAVLEHWPDAKLGIGPVVGDGFYYDIDSGESKITEADFGKIEKSMQAIIKRGESFEKSEKSIEEAIKWAKDSKQDYKLELLNDLNRAGTTLAKDLSPDELGTIAKDTGQVNKVSFYTNGNFTDLCRGPHVAATNKVGAFKLTKVAGAYWRGDETKPQMQRLYGVAFKTQAELDEYLKNQELAAKNDHRIIGKELDLFTTSDLVGSGLPLFTPRGTWLRELLGAYSQQLRADKGFERVWTPHITKPELYKTSGHWDKFGDELFLVKSQESSDEFAMKPMNCPHHTQIYAAKPRSYKDLPIKYMETTTDYRDEKSGELHGLTRVRSLTQDDSHVFCSEEQIGEAVGELLEAAQTLYEELGMELKFRLSFRDDSDAYFGEQQLWDRAQDKIEEQAKHYKLDYYIEEGEAAFYGPKIDFVAIDGMGREWQTATVQLDFVQPERFGLEYASPEGLKTPVMVHSALLGTLERFLGVYIEHTAGHFPFWLAPEQVRVLTVNEKTAEYVRNVRKILEASSLDTPLRANQLRFSIDSRSESLGKKIKEAELLKIPLFIIVGEKDQAAGQVSLRTQEGESKIDLSKLSVHINKIK